MTKKLTCYAVMLLLALLPALACNKKPVVLNPTDTNATPTPTPNAAQLTFQRLAALTPVQGKAVTQIAILLNQELRPSGEPYLSSQALADIKAKLKLVLEDAQTVSNKFDQLPTNETDAQKIIDGAVDLLRLANSLNAISALPTNFKTGLQHVVNWAEQLAASAKLLLPLLKQKKSVTLGADGTLQFPTSSVPLNLQNLDQLDSEASRIARQRDLQTLLIGFGVIIAATVNDTRLILKETDGVKLIALRKQAYEAVFPLLL